MKKFAIFIVCLILGVYFVDRIGGRMMAWVSMHTHSVSGDKIRYLVNEVNEDVVCLGTSRCNNLYVASIIQDSLGCSVYNGGITASENIYSHYLLLNLILSRHTPKVVCLDLYCQDFHPDVNTSFRAISYYAPFYGINERADSVFLLNETYNLYKISHLYRYNSKAVNNLVGLLVDMQASLSNGYTPLPQPLQIPQALNYSPTVKEKDELKIEYINKFIKACEERKIKLVFVISPMYERINKDYYALIYEIAHQNNIPLLDYHTTGLFHDHPEYFAGINHLWDAGARAYSSILAHDLKQVLAEP